MGRVYRSGAIEFDVESAMLHGPAGAQPLRKQVARTLDLLMSRAPALVPTDEILDNVWGRHAISASAVPQAIRELRRALGDEAQHPRYVETRHRLGYRWIEPVTLVQQTYDRAPSAAVVVSKHPESLDPSEGMAGRLETARDHSTPAPPTSPGPLPTSHGSGSTGLGVGRFVTRPLAFWVLPLAIALVLMLLVGLFVAGPGPTGPRPDSITLASDPRWSAAYDAFLEYRLDDADAQLASLPLDTAAAAALRARLAIVRADGKAADVALAEGRARLDPEDRAGQHWLDAIEAHAAGREIEAWTRLEPLLALRPTDTTVLLAAWELRRRIPGDRVAALATAIESSEGIPSPRRALLRAQVAGARKDRAMQREQALHAIEVHGANYPAIAALARMELAAAAEALRDPGLAETSAAEASRTLEGLGLRRAAIRASADAAWSAMLQERLDDAEANLARVQRLLEGHHDPSGAITMQHYRALMLRRRGESAQAVEAFVALAADYEALGDFRAAANALNSSIEPRHLLGRSDEVPAVLERAIALARRSQAHDTLGYLHGTLGNHYIRSGDLDLGHEALTLALQAFQSAGDRPAEATALGNLGEVAVMRGRLDDAVDYVERAREIARALDDSSGLAYADLRLARIHSARGDLAQATGAATQAVARFVELGNRKEEATARRHLGRLHLRGADVDRAREQRRAIDAIEDNGALVNAERAYLAASVALYDGEFAQARQLAGTAATLWLEAGQPLDAGIAEVLALEARLALGDQVAVDEEARSLLKQPVVGASSLLRRGVGLVLAEAMMRGSSRTRVAPVISEVEQSLASAPDAEDELRVVLLRARLDQDDAARRDRLAWVAAEAGTRQLPLFLLEAEGERAAQEGPAAWAAWRSRAAERAPGLARVVERRQR